MKNTENNSKLKELTFFVNYNENHRFVLGGSMGEMIGRAIPNILLFIYREG